MLPTRSVRPFEVISEYAPSGDQPQAIRELAQRINAGETDVVLLGATGTGKSATTAWLHRRGWLAEDFVWTAGLYYYHAVTGIDPMYLAAAPLQTDRLPLIAFGLQRPAKNHIGQGIGLGHGRFRKHLGSRRGDRTGQAQARGHLVHHSYRFDVKVRLRQRPHKHQSRPPQLQLGAKRLKMAILELKHPAGIQVIANP